jgi:hypothetical protein
MIDAEKMFSKNNILEPVVLHGTLTWWRMHYAGLAMQAYLSDSDTAECMSPKIIAEFSFAISDAMIEASKETK